MAGFNCMVRFIADTMLGRLALWLRVLGFDVAYYHDIDDGSLIGLALSEERIVLTRDRMLARRRLLRGRVVLIESNYTDNQLLQVVGLFGIPEDRLFSRCLRCNHRLSSVDREAVKGLVPAYIYSTHKRFSRCAHCGRIYWAGTHREHMLKRLKELLHL